MTTLDLKRLRKLTVASDEIWFEKNHHIDERAYSKFVGKMPSTTITDLLNAIDEKDRMLDEARAALEGLMEAHRVVFKSSLFPAFQAGKTNFNGAWVKADATLAKLEEMKR